MKDYDVYRFVLEFLGTKKDDQVCYADELHDELLARGAPLNGESLDCVHECLAVLIDEKKLHYWHKSKNHDGASIYSLRPFDDNGNPIGSCIYLPGIIPDPHLFGDSDERVKEKDKVIKIVNTKDDSGLKGDPGRRLDPLVDYVITWRDEDGDQYWTKDGKQESDIMHSMVESFADYDNALLNVISVQGSLADNCFSLKEFRDLNVRVIKRTINVTLEETFPGPLEI